MNDSLTDAQRNLLYKLVLGGEPLGLDVAKKKLRGPLESAGLVELIPHPTKKRSKACVATETGWAWVVDRIHEPIRSASVQLRDPWNALVAKLARFLEVSDANLAMVLNVDVLGPEQDGVRLLRAAYDDLTGGALRRRVLIAELRARTEPKLDAETFDQTVRALLDARRVSVFPEDDRAALRLEDHQGAFQLSGIPMHILYWEN